METCFSISGYLRDNQLRLPFAGPLTHEKLVMRALLEGPNSAPKLAVALGLIKDSVRRILGEGTKAGKFVRLSRGVYGLKNANGSFLYVESADAVASLPKLAQSGVKADFIFLDPPYRTRALEGVNRGVTDYPFITPQQFSAVVGAAKTMLRDDSSPLVFMYSQARSGGKHMSAYVDAFDLAGMRFVKEGSWLKTFKSGAPVTNARGDIAAAEGIAVYSRSGTLSADFDNIEFDFVRPQVTGKDARQSQKPVELYDALLTSVLKDVPEAKRPDFVALDPFAGTGNLGVAAIKAGVSAILLELMDSVIDRFIGPKLEAASSDSISRTTECLDG